MKQFVSVRDLASRLGFTAAYLWEVADLGDTLYRIKKKRDKKGKPRTFEVPSPEVMKIQRRIVQLLAEYPTSPAAHGATKGRSAQTNAEQHLGQPMLVTIDIRKCYPSMSHEQVFAMFRRDFGFGDEVSSLLTRLTTYRRHLPQGAATSPAIANALLAELVDRALIELAAMHGVVYTRYIDDLAFSGEDPRPMIYEAASRLSKLGLKIDRGDKLQIATSDGRQKLTGLLVNSPDAASVGRRYLAKVRSAIHRFSKLPRAAQITAAESIKGRIVYVRRRNPGAAERLAKQFATVCPQPAA